MTKNLRCCLRFFSYILEQRETDRNIIYREWLQNHSFYVQNSQMLLQNRIHSCYNSLVLIIIYDEGKKIS